MTFESKLLWLLLRQLFYTLGLLFIQRLVTLNSSKPTRTKKAFNSLYLRQRSCFFYQVRKRKNSARYLFLMGHARAPFFFICVLSSSQIPVIKVVFFKIANGWIRMWVRCKTGLFVSQAILSQKDCLLLM